ncbi:hypothetical protein P280DRAFT_542225 [Massarina eburnea CBS 473.64]|uniref:Rhodopsin domain-containing protein n=1 Tax=Massarina eburnea CBS 473.64 TaxID=1395130 RepID=A0A6A6RZW2_9PLEO|nr:hypothetical protein P280DRAFT_542225 [Massarina eburnea CBS 473.64]
MAEIFEDTSTAPTMLGLGISLQIITVGLVGVRIKARLQMGKQLQVHDWAILFAELFSLPQLIFIVDAILNGYGRHAPFVPLPNITKALHSVFIAQVIWYWSATLVKVSVVCLILSLRRTSRAWLNFCYTAIVILLSALAMITATQFLACRPLSVYWDPMVGENVVCWPKEALLSMVVGFSVIQALADVVFSFIPLTFLLHLKQPLRQKIIISILMSLGLMASGTAIARTVIGVQSGGDMFRRNADITLLALLDLHVGIIAATLPTLKVFFEGVLVKLVEGTKSEKTEEDVRTAFCEMGLLDMSHYPGKLGKGQKSVEGDIGLVKIRSER